KMCSESDPQMSSQVLSDEGNASKAFLRHPPAIPESPALQNTLKEKSLKANTLFNIWIKYKPRLPDWYYNEKLLKVGDLLIQIKEYKLALLQCYGRYLQQFSSINLDEVIADVNQFKSMFFPNGFGDKSAALTFHALQGRNICIYQMVCISDRNLQNQESLQMCFNILSSLRLIMQVALPQEHLCWLIYNGTIYIYTICRRLMSIGQSAKVLEYLLWASICMESSVPLLAVHYLTWRITLYTAVCYCYYDNQANIHGEVFARRGLSKIDELKQLESMSCSPQNSETKKVFREATIKMAVMVFKRAVYESRRKPKGFFRPKLRVNLKEAQNLPWPRTVTERLLTEMFDGTAAHFLAILEALSDSNRRVLRPAPPVPDETEIRDVVSELFFMLKIALILLNVVFFKRIVFLFAIVEKNGVSGEAAMKFIKLAFSYEEWDVFDSTIGLIANFLQNQDDPIWKKAEMELRLIIAMQPLVSTRRSKHGLSVQENIFKEATISRSSGRRTIALQGVRIPKTLQPDKEILVDIVMFLWQKCKVGVQRIQMSGSAYLKYIYKFKAYKWVHILWIINEVIHSSNIVDANVVVLAEVTLRLTAILENIGSQYRGWNRENLVTGILPGSDQTIPEILTKSPAEQLHFAYENLEKAINGMNMSRLMTILPDGKSVLDTYCTKVKYYRPIRNNFVMDLHLELIQAQHRVAVKLLNMKQESDIMNKIKKNKLSKAIFLMQKAVLIFPKGSASSSQKHLLEEALALIQKVEAEQNALCSSLKQAMTSKKNRIPPPPLLLSRSHCSMTFKPAPFSSDVQVSWYSILGCVAAGSNLKVRLNNHHLPNAGEEIPADGKSLFEIKGLDPNEKYIFAVAAYSSDGKLIGDAIGETTKPILAYPPLSATTARAYLTQIAYQTDNYTLAKKAFSPMWDYFVLAPSTPSADPAVISASNNLTISQNRLCLDAVSQTSPILLHLFLRSIFIINEINVKEGALFCDSICSKEILYNGQVARLAECERMVVAIELSNWLNDANYALQSVVQCYGLLAPIIYHKIASVPVVQILIKCLTVLQEVPSSTLQRKQTGCYESIQHMIACSSFYTVLRSWKEYELALIIINYGKKLLDSSQTSLGCFLVFNCSSRKNHTILVLLDVLWILFNLVINLGTGPEITGQEDPFFLYPIISCWTTKNAYREVMKFRKKPRFLEFFVQVLHKTLNEEKFQRILEWTGSVKDFLRSKSLLMYNGVILLCTLYHFPSIIALEGTTSVLLMYKIINMFLFRKQRDEIEKVAFHTLVVLLNPTVSNYLKRKRFHQVCLEEMPWRSQMNIYLAITHFNLFKKRLEEQYNIGVCSLQHLNRYDHSIKFSEADTPRSQMTNDTELSMTLSAREHERPMSNAILLEHFTKTFLHLRRAVVLAHRGGHWTLLQNTCRELWNYSQEALSVAKHSHSLQGLFPITRNFLISTIWLPFYLASDTILDMIIELQTSNSLKIFDPEGDFCVPSCVGGIADEDGGSNLTFCCPLDDINVVDLRWICGLVLRTIELLYQMKKWEALVHIALHFNTITHERYAEQVTPLLIYAQRQLLERIQQFRGPDSPQPHFIKYQGDNANKINCRNFIGKQLRIASTFNEVKVSGHHFVPEIQAQALVCVPLDVTDTLKCFRETLEKSKYHSRALRHSRKLLSLFLAHTQEILQINNQRDLKVQALHELGNLHFYAGKKRSAFKYWCQALDETLNIADVLNNWQELDGFSKNVTDDFTDESSKHFSEKCIYQAGIWGCLHAAVLAAKIAQYILTSNVRLRTKCCIFSAILFKTLFKVSIPHPTADCDFAQYEIHKLIPGIDLFSDRYRADVSTVVASLSFLIFELHCAKQNLIVLPLFTLYQYFVSEICRDPVKCIEGRILKIKVLTDLGFFAEAFSELCLLNHGEKIPWKVPAGYRLIGKMMVKYKFDSSKPLLTNANLQVLEDVFNWSLPPAVVSMCDQQIMNKLTLAKMHLIICLSATINSIPEKVMKTIYSVDNTSLKKPITRPQEQSTIIVQLVRCKDELNMAMLKGILLTETEERLNSLVANIQNEYDGKISHCSTVELETVIEAKLQLAVISQQRHQTAFSAALAFSAIRLLQDANIFRKNVPHIQLNIQQTEHSTQLPCNVIAQEHMNIRLWLRCRMALVTALTAQIRGIGDMKENDMTDCSSLINEVIIEAEAFSDIETQAEVMVQAVILDLQERRPVTGIKLLLQDIINLLQEKPFISPMASLTLVKSMLLLADILTTQTDEDTEHHSSAIERLNLLILAHKFTIKQIFTLGEPIEQCIEDPALTSPVIPLKNNYLPAINLLAKVKMRIGKKNQVHCSCTSKRENPLQWLPALSHLETALDLCRTSATRELDLQAEILFQKGKQNLGCSLLALKSMHLCVYFCRLIRKSYLEIALLYFHLATYKEEASQTVKIEASKTKVSEAMLASQLLIGKKSVKGHQVKATTQQNIPEFASMDLLASYKDFLSEIIQSEKDQIESEGTEYNISKDSQWKQTITWVHLIRYHNYLIRHNMSPLFAVSKSIPGSFSMEDALFTSVFDTGIVLRLAEMHIFLKKHLYIYSTCCLEDFPKQLQFLEKPGASLAAVPVKVLRIASTVSFCTDTDIQLDNKATIAPNKELCIQWYIPSLEKSTKDMETMRSQFIPTVILKSCLLKKYCFYLCQVPFDVTLQSIKNLEKMFDPANGCMIAGGSLFNWVVSLLP
uniref:Cilia and flagella associated protein 54 n=1 Tax=Chrysemys picta bellii TaxID=8478 RepID=A0A8C3F4F5_CHRPI